MNYESQLLAYLYEENISNENLSIEKKTMLKKQALEDPIIKRIQTELTSQPASVLKRHNDAKLPLHKLAFLAETGFNYKELRIEAYIENIMKNKTEEGVVPTLMNIPRQFGGTGEDSHMWMLCDAPLLFYSLLKLGVDSARLEKGINYLMSLGDSYGFPCAADPSLPKFNGPGKRGTICPYASLLMIRLYSAIPERHDDENCHKTIEAILDKLESRDKYYLFGTGKKFRKLKYPYIWYDSLHVAEVFSRFDFVLTHKRFLAFTEEIFKKENDEGLYKAESVWKAWGDLDSGQKKYPSQWMTYAVKLIEKRIKRAS